MKRTSQKARMLRWISTALLVAGTLLGVRPASASAPAEDAGTPTAWLTTWATAMQYPRAPFDDEANWSLPGFADDTLRQVVRTSIGGDHTRILLSNRYGTAPLHIRGATIAATRRGAAVAAGSMRVLRFGGSLSVTVPPGSELRSDPVAFRARPLQSLSVTLYVDRPSGPATYHDAAFARTYRAGGDHRFDRHGRSFTRASGSWYFLTGVEVLGSADRGGTIAAFGDSLTDGLGTVPEADNRYPDQLAELLAARGTPRPVANLGINGNKLLVDSPCFGEMGLTRFAHQALDRPGVDTAVVAIGLNDIGSAGWPVRICGQNPAVTADAIVTAYRQLVRAAHDRGVRVIGATFTPFKGHAYSTPLNEATREEVNARIRAGGIFDAVVDFEAALADPADPDAIDPAYDSGDHVHPNDAGRQRLAEAVLEVL